VVKLNSVLNAVLATPEVRGRIKDLGMEPAGPSSPPELAAFLQSEIARWGKIVEAAGLARSA